MNGNNQSQVDVGSWVKVKDDLYNEEEVFHIGSATNPQRNEIAADSDLGRALLGSRIGDEVVLEAPSGEVKFEILEVGQKQS
jgi:transcription elongation factor GreA